jgi:hypothetical protein
MFVLHSLFSKEDSLLSMIKIETTLFLVVPPCTRISTFLLPFLQWLSAPFVPTPFPSPSPLWCVIMRSIGGVWLHGEHRTSHAPIVVGILSSNGPLGNWWPWK